jgi:hypothetical protein
MLFVKGLLMCMSHYGEAQDKAALIESLNEMIRLTPIDLLINLQGHFKLQSIDIADVITCYNEFLFKLNDVETRQILSEINMKDIYQKECFIDLRNTADSLQTALNKIFIGNNDTLSSLTLKYGLF